MRRNWRGVISLSLAAVMVAAAFTGCAKNGGEASNGKTKLVMALWDETQNKTMEKMISVYEEENPDVTVETQLTTWAEYWTKLEASITGGNAADIIWVNVLKAEGYADNGILMDVSEVAKELDLAANYPEALVEGYNYEGKQYAIPKDFDTNALFYNKELFDKAKVAYPTEDWTLEDMQEAAEQLKAGLSEGEFACAIAFNTSQTTFLGSIRANGGYLLNDAKTKSGWDDPKTIAAIKPWLNMVTSGVSASQEQMADTTPDTLFEGGKLAMYMAGDYMISEFEQNDAIKGKFDLVSRPSFNGKKTDVINGLGYAVNANTKNKEAAFRFLTWLGQEEAMKIQGQDGNVISARNDCQQYFAEVNKGLDLNLGVFTAHLDDTVLLEPRCKKYSELGVIQSNYLPEIWSGEISLEEGCKKIAEESQVVIDQMNGK